ncbi:PAC2 family protein [Lapillicoccus sp.]|uniref:PAC2 family protein n=1 Tax=Lapillicoccus sp. TaxID=1909287 RepID=UPI0025D6CFDD|nr:PAC2 family protein [Lapillicoccus sp.]
MQDPSALYRFETDTNPASARASVLLVSLGGFIDAGRTQHVLTSHLLEAHDHTVVASFDIDQLLDYRGRRPMMTFDRDRWTSYDDPSLLLYRLTDKDGQPFLLLTGAEPDYQWERVVEAVTGLIRILGVDITISVHGIPMAVPHTRPLGVTAHATDPRLIADNQVVFGAVQVPGSLSSLLEMRLGESGRDAIGYAVHVPHYLAQTEFPDAALIGLGAVSGATGLNLKTTDLAAAAGLNRAELAREIAGSEEVAGVVEALERQYDTFMEGRERPSLLATEIAELPSADEIGAELEAFLQGVADDTATEDTESTENTESPESPESPKQPEAGSGGPHA